MSRSAPVIVSLLLGCAGVLLDAQQRFTAFAEAVRVDVLVTDGNTLVRNLTATDFELRDSGVRQQVEQVQVEQVPLNIMLVLDTSGSVAGPRLHYLLEAGRALVAGLHGEDRAALVSFATRVRLLVPLTQSRIAILAELVHLTGAGSTSLRDAAYAGLAVRETDPGRTLMVLFSDGADTSSWLTAAKVIETARRTDVVVYPVGVSASGKFLHDLADVTGGRVMMAGADAHLQATFAAILAEFRNRYVLSYEPRGVQAGGWHPIEVKLKGKRGKVTARRGYFVQ